MLTYPFMRQRSHLLLDKLFELERSDAVEYHIESGPIESWIK